jgi:hypothetical protein
VVDKVIGFLALIISLTALSVVLSKRSNTPKVLDSLLKGIRGLQQTAISPIVK